MSDEQAIQCLQEQSEAEFWKLVIQQDPGMEKYVDHCQRDLIGNDCRCPACEMRKVEAAEYAQDGSEGR